MNARYQGIALAVLVAAGGMFSTTTFVEAQTSGATSRMVTTPPVAITPLQIAAVQAACAGSGGGCVAAVQALTATLTATPGVTAAAALGAITSSLSAASNGLAATPANVAARSAMSNALSATASVARGMGETAVAQVAAAAASTVSAGNQVDMTAVASAPANQNTPNTPTGEVGDSASAQ